MSVPVKKQLDEEVLKQRIEDEKAKRESEEKRRKHVFNCIEALAETVDEDTLLSMLDLFDVNSWKEVVEERFIGRICGWPLCHNEVIVKKSQRYKLDKSRQKVYENFTDREKFCSQNCYQKSEHLQGQLAELPLWLTGERTPKHYDINYRALPIQPSKSINTDDKTANEKIEFIPDNLLVQLNSLHLGEINASDGEDTEDENAVDPATFAVDDKQFLSNIQSFITAKMPAVNKNNKDITPSLVQKKVIEKMDKETMESKLEKLRSKYGKLPKEKQKKAPIMVEPHRDATPIKSKKEGVIRAEEVMERLSVWITERTIRYIDQKAAEPTTSDSMEAGDVQGKQVLEQFYSGILDSRDYDKKKTKEEEIKSVKLPLVDSIDQHYRRVEIVLAGLKKAWVSYVGQLKITYPVNNTKDLISTFGLEKDNCVIDPKSSEYFATAILQIMSRCNNDLKELLERDETVEYHRKYYDLLQIDYDFFDF